MHHQHSGNILRTRRRSAGLTQHELTRLMGFQSRSHLSRIERGEQVPKLEHALRYELLFGVSIAEVAPNLCLRIQNGLWEDICQSLEVLALHGTRKAKHKSELLRTALKRIESLNS